MFETKVEISGDRATLRLSFIPGGGEAWGVDMNATAVETLISGLAAARADMRPALSTELDPDAVRVEGIRKSIVATDPEGRRVVLAGLHPGYGWIVMEMSPDEARQIAGKLSSSAAKLDRNRSRHH